MAPLLEVDSVSKSFGGLMALHDVSFKVEAGSTVSIIGPNGAGKTTLFNLISGALTPDSGEIRFDGRSIKGFRPNQTALLGIGRTFQIVRPFPGLTTLGNVALAALSRARTRREAEGRAAEILEITRLAPYAQVEARQLTLARRKRLEIARAMALQPRLILLDEVMAGLTPTEVDETIGLIKELNRMGVSAVAGVEHVMQAVMKISDWIIVLNSGCWLAEGTPAQIVRDPAVIRAYLGTHFAAPEEEG